MPTYSYACSNCGAELDIVQKMSDDKITQCTACNKETLERVITPAGGFRITGPGVYHPTSRLG